MDEDLERILNAGNSAPSGENCQPWKFAVAPGRIEVHLRPERDQSAYNWGQRASYLACGAVIENICIEASSLGYNNVVNYLPSVDQNHVATILLERRANINLDSLAQYIHKRATNRKRYKKQPLSSVQKEQILKAGSAEQYGKIVLIDDPHQLAALARDGATNEIVMLKNDSLHNFFFSHVNWTKKEDDQKKIGFYIKTLELPPPAQVLFKAMSNKSAMRWFRKLGFPSIVGSQNAATYASSAAIGAVIADGSAAIDFIRTGRVVERIWLTTTALGLSLQPLTGVLFFSLKLENHETNSFSTEEIGLIKKAYADIQNIFDAKGKRVPFMFRVGVGPPPSAQASRFSLSDTITVRG